ncbi:hypothetical protein SAMN05443572_111219 [Myxococcus fulvus]|nr:hypothetical protein [Myxococcus fulvus]AKF85455.1 hypothetical protein MFUL124B02_12895 [Myxococcus fulvus 124B02]SEU36542.1 hypothetical protein SAMN05443572_111219 [Myxococcus fulvus]
MVRRVLAFAAFVSIIGCGGAEVAEGTETGALPEQEVSAQAVSCEARQGKVCSPETEISCTWANGTWGYCMCQAIPHNRWVCLTD